MRRALLIALVIVVPIAAGEDDPAAFDASKHPWARFPVGTEVRFRVSEKKDDGQVETKEFTKTLREVKDGRCKVAVKTAEAELTEEFLLVKPETMLWPKDCPPKFVEDITIPLDEKKYACKIWEAPPEPGINKELTQRAAIAADGTVVLHCYGVHQGGEFTPEFMFFKLAKPEAKVTLAGAERTCKVYSARPRNTSDSPVSLVYFCDEVPGRLARVEVMKSSLQKEPFRIQEVVGWETPKKDSE